MALYPSTAQKRRAPPCPGVRGMNICGRMEICEYSTRAFALFMNLSLIIYCFRYKKPTALPAQKYIELLMDWIETQINNESVFPVSTGRHFRKNA